MPSYVSPTDVYNRSGLTSTEIDLSSKTQIIEDAEAEFEALTGRKFTSAISATEYFDAGSKDIFENKRTTIQTKLYPLLSVTSFVTLNTDGTTNTTYTALSAATVATGDYDTDEYWLETFIDPLTNTIKPNGKIILKSTNFPTGVRNIKLVYTYGYATVPYEVRACVSCLAGVRAWIAFLGGSYNRLDSYSIPQQSVSKGDFYNRGQVMIKLLTEEANRLLERIGRRPSIFLGATGASI